MSESIVCFTGFRKENKAVVAHCIKLVHYMGGSVRKEYNKRITHLIVKSAMSTKYKTAYNIGRCYLLTEDWILDSWKHRNEIDFNVNDSEYVIKF
jgi:protein ECT2